MYIRSKQRP